MFNNWLVNIHKLESKPIDDPIVNVDNPVN